MALCEAQPAKTREWDALCVFYFAPINTFMACHCARREPHHLCVADVPHSAPLTVLVHPSSHLLLHENDAYRELMKMTCVSIGSVHSKQLSAAMPVPCRTHFMRVNSML